jgi:hypothetical protein
MEAAAGYLCMAGGLGRTHVRKSVKKRRRGYSGLWRRTEAAVTRAEGGKAKEQEGGRLVVLRRRIVRRKSSVVSKKGGREWGGLAGRVRRKSSGVAKKETEPPPGRREAAEDLLDSWAMPEDPAPAARKASVKRRKSVQRRNTFLMKKRLVMKTQSVEPRPWEPARARTVRRPGYVAPPRWSSYLRAGRGEAGPAWWAWGEAWPRGGGWVLPARIVLLQVLQGELGEDLDRAVAEEGRGGQTEGGNEGTGNSQALPDKLQV